MSAAVQTRPGRPCIVRPSPENALTPPRAQAAPANRVLAAVPLRERNALLALCEPVELAFAEVLATPGEVMRHAYFPLDALISLGISVPGESRWLEVALVDRAGILGLPLVLGDGASPLRATVAGAGSALRIAADPFRRRLRASPGLLQALHAYLLLVMGRLARAAFCTRYHLVEQRLAGWLLMTQDSADRSSFDFTHEYLAATLGVRRAGVTRAAAHLQRLRLIRYSRGHLVIVDRIGLQGAACPCHAPDLSA